MPGPRGPLPNPSRRRRNEPTIPTTNLPAAGRRGRLPRIPPGLPLDKAGRAWWKWAWSTPQAAGWAHGHEPTVARRASLEDDLFALGEVRGVLDLAEVLGIDERRELVQHLDWTLAALKRLAGGKLAIFKEMRELEDRLGLSPKAMAALRWSVVGESPDVASPQDMPANVSPLDERRRRIAGGDA